MKVTVCGLTLPRADELSWLIDRVTGAGEALAELKSLADDGLPEWRISKESTDNEMILNRVTARKN